MSDTTSTTSNTAATTTRYDAATDSNAAHKDEARRTGRAVLVWGAGLCLCGCGRGTASRFAPGHDARLRGVLARLEANGAGLRLRDGKTHADTTPGGLAAKLDTAKHSWTAQLAADVERARKAEQDRAAKAKAAAAKKAAAKTAKAAATRPTLADFAA